MDLIRFDLTLLIIQLIFLIIVGVIGFFAWRRIVTYFLSKGPKGINTLAVIIAAFQVPILIIVTTLLIIFLV